MPRPALPRRSLPISRLLLLAVGSLLALAGGSALLLLRATSEHLLIEVGTRSVLRTMDLVETVVRSQLDPAQLQVESLGRLMQAPKVDLANSDQIADILQGALASTPQIRVLAYCDAQLKFLSVVRDANGAGLTVDQFDAHDNDLVSSLDAMMRSADAARWGELIDAKVLNRTLLNVRYPIRRNGQYQGFLVAGVTTREMSRVAKSMRDLVGISTYLSLSIGRQQILAHPALAADERATTARQLFEELTAKHERHTLNVRKFEEAVANPLGWGEVEVFQFDYDGDKFAGFTRSLDGYGEPPLVIGAYCAAKTLYAPQRLLYSATATAFVVLAVALGLAAWLSRAISKPIRRVSAGVTQVGQFNLHDIDEMSPSRLREVDDLAKSFNRMLAALRSLSTYIPRKLAELVVQGVVGASVGTERRELTVMFTDIAEFTALSEGMDATEVAEFINEHLTMLAECVDETGGTIDKYIGDALMAFWGAPQRLENTAEAACRAAALMARRLGEDNRRRVAAAQPPVRLRIGIHTGPLVVGNIGAAGRINYTVVGDTVNVAQRLESLGKQVDADAEVIVLLSAATAAQVTTDFVTHPEGDFQLRGKQRDITVLRLDV